MATFSRLFTRRACRSAISSSKTVNPTFFAQPLQTRLYHGYGTQQQVTNAFIGRILFSSFESTRSLCIPLVLASVVGVGILDVAYADTSEVSADSPLPPDIPSSYDNLEEIAKKEQCRLEELIRSKGMKYGSYPQFTVTVKGKKIAIKFPVPSYCDIPGLILNLALSLNGGSVMDVQIRASLYIFSIVNSQLALRLPNGKIESGNSKFGEENISNDSDLCVIISRPVISPHKLKLEVLKKGSFSPAELEALVSIMQIAGERPGQTKAGERPGQTKAGERPGQSKAGERSSSAGTASTSKSITSLEAMGVRVFGLNE